MNRTTAVRTVLLGGWVGILIWWERMRALRSVADPKLKRDVRNVAVAATAGVTMQVLELPVAFHLAREADKKHRGLLQALPLPKFVRTLAAVALLDYTLYWYHVLAHRIPLLWRFHQAHHLDREMDATTGLRFHYGEIALSVGFRAAQVFVLGPSPADLEAWQSFLFACILFHHSNARLPLHWERRVARLIVTPRLHGIHHSVASEEVNANWSSGFTAWDWLHRTLRTDVPQEAIVIGVEGHRDDSDQELRNVFMLPFRDGAAVPPMPEERSPQSISALR